MKTYINIGTLDLRNATDKELGNIGRIESVDTLIVNENQIEKIKHIEQINIGNILTQPIEVNVISHNGDYKLTKLILEGIKEKVTLKINGTLTIDPINDVLLLEKIFKGTINGRLIAQDLDFANLSTKFHINGDTVIYEAGEQLIDGRFVLNDINLYGFMQESKLVVDNLVAIEAVDEALFNETISSIRVLEYIVASQDQIRKIARKISNYSEVEKFIVPVGYQYFDKMILNQETLNNLNSDKIFVRTKVKVDMDVSKIKEKISKIICKQLEVSASDIDKMMSIIEKVDKIKQIDPNAVKNMSLILWNASYFEEIAELTMTNYGKINIDDTVTVEILDEKIKSIDNYGMIQCPENLYSHIMKKTKINYGIIKSGKPFDLKETFNIKDRGNIIKNMSSIEL